MTLKTVTIAVALAVAGVLLGMNLPIAEAQRGGPYALSSSGSKGVAVWRMNQRTGQVSICLFEGGSGWKAETKTLTPKQTASLTPRCSPWGPAAEL